MINAKSGAGPREPAGAAAGAAAGTSGIFIRRSHGIYIRKSGYSCGIFIRKVGFSYENLKTRFGSSGCEIFIRKVGFSYENPKTRCGSLETSRHGGGCSCAGNWVVLRTTPDSQLQFDISLTTPGQKWGFHTHWFLSHRMYLSTSLRKSTHPKNRQLIVYYYLPLPGKQVRELGNQQARRRVQLRRGIEAKRRDLARCEVRLLLLIKTMLCCKLH